MPGRQINLLCIDGGGSKGLSALFILRKLMEFINPDNPPKPCEWFDMIGGTSTGGILAIMLGRLEMTVDECVEEYLALQNSAYVPIIGQYRYNHLTLEEGIKDILRKRGLPDDVLLKNTNKTACKVFVTATRAGSTTTEVLSSYYRRRGAAELFNTATVWQAARATSAASDFFRPVDIGPSERRFLDGETGANNPIFIMWEEAQNLLPSTGKVEQELNCLVSIGCGIKSLHKFGEDTSSLAQTLARIAIETENTAARFLNDKSLIADAGMYYRFSAPSVGDVEDVEERASVVQMTDHYIDARDTQDQLQLCTSKLLQRHGIASSIQTSDVRQAALIKSGNWSSQTIAYSGTSEREHFDIFDRMSKYDSDGTLERLSEYKCLGTCNWVVNKPSFRQWMELKTGSCFALTGIVGSGKTTCTTTVVEFLQDWASSTGRQVFHFFYESSFQSRLTALDVLEAFLKQMIIANPKIPDTLRSRVWKYYGPQAGRPHIGQLGKYLFLPLARYLNNAIFVIDGLYECEPTSQQDLMQLSPLLVAEGASLFLTLRESSGLMRRFENDSNVTICDCSLTEEGVKRDLETFITALIKEQNIRQRITEDQRTLALIKTALLGKTDAMFLWAKLIVIDIWAECSDVNSIEVYLENRLPLDLGEIYARCRSRVSPLKTGLSKDIFELVCAAVEPFTIEELQAMLTVTEENSELRIIREMPLVDVICECGASLLRIGNSSPRLVLPIHHSVRQHVFPTEQLKPESTERTYGAKLVAELKIGLICMLYIRQRSSRSLVKGHTKPLKVSYKDVSTIGFMQSPWIRTAYNKLYGTHGQIPTISTQIKPIYNLTDDGALSSYAQRSWIQSNTNLKPRSIASWDMFAKLVLERHYGVTYPWPRLATSHLHGLFTWAVTHNHIALLEHLTNEPHLQNAKKIDLFNKPLLPPDEGFALHHAVRSGNSKVFPVLFPHVQHWKTDDDGNTALHLGAFAGNDYITSFYAQLNAYNANAKRSRSRRYNNQSSVRRTFYEQYHLRNTSGHNPLHAAMSGGSINCVSHVMDVAALLQVDWPSALENWQDAQDYSGLTPLDLAIAHGSIEFIIDCVSLYPRRGIKPPHMSSPMKTMIRFQKWDLLVLILRRPDLPGMEYPFDKIHPLPHVAQDDDTSPSCNLSNAIELIHAVVSQPSWVPLFLMHSWDFRKGEWREYLSRMYSDPDEFATGDEDHLLLSMWLLINKCRVKDFHDRASKIPSDSFWEGPTDANHEIYPPTIKQQQVTNLWSTVLALEAIGTCNQEALKFILTRCPTYDPLLLYEAACLNDDTIKKLLLKLLQNDKEAFDTMQREAGRIAASRGNLRVFLQSS